MSAFVLLLALCLPHHPSEAAPSRMRPITLDSAERAWLLTPRRIRVHFEAWPPFLLEQGGRPHGISIDYLELICKQLGIEIDYVRLPWSKALASIREGKDLDVLPILTRAKSRETFLRFTRDYVSYPIVIFSRRASHFIGSVDDLNGRRTVVERDYAMQTRLRQKLPGTRLVLVRSTLEALNALSVGRADAYVGNLAVGSYLIQRHGLTNLKVAAPTPFGEHTQAMGVRKSAPILARILDKGLAAVTEHGHDEIRQRWLSVRYEHGLTYFDVGKWVLAVTAVAGLMILVILLANRRLKREILGRRRIEAKLQQNQAELVEAQRLAQLGSWRQDAQTGHFEWSAEARRIFGRDPESSAPLTDAQVCAMIAPEDLSSYHAALARAPQEGPQSVELRILRADGTRRTIVLRVAAAPKQPGLVGTFQDVTEREQLEEQVRQTQKLESLGLLAGGIAHDFNNLLVGISTNAELMKQSCDDQPVGAEPLDDIIEATRRASELSQQMLAYAGKQPIIRQQVDLRSITHELLRALKPSLSPRATFELDFADKLPQVDVDAVQVRQLVMNLIMNASDALGDAAGQIRLSIHIVKRSVVPQRETLRPGIESYVCLCVSDDGCGMDAETQRRLFDPFFTTKFAGRGLGMAAVLGIVRAHHGAIHVESHPGKGTSFTLFLEAAQGEPGEHAPHALADPPPTVIGTVLIIDDEALVRSAVRRVLTRDGHQVLLAEDGHEGVQLFREQREDIDCVLLDLTMPGMDGVQTLAALRELDPKVCVLVISGYQEGDVGTRFKAIGEPPAGFLHKPFDVQLLSSTVSRILTEKAPTRRSDPA